MTVTVTNAREKLKDEHIVKFVPEAVMLNVRMELIGK